MTFYKGRRIIIYGGNEKFSEEGEKCVQECLEMMKK